MITISKLFGRSPFAPLQAHMEKVAACVEKLKEICNDLQSGDYEQLCKKAYEISKLEHAADLTKNSIRESLPRTLFLPIDRTHLLDILTLQDSIADKCEDVATLLALRKLELHPSFSSLFQKLLAINLDAFYEAHRIIDELPELLESSFGGREAEKVRTMVEKVATKEHEGDILQRELLKILYGEDDLQLPYPLFHLWLHIFEEVGAISNLSENLAYRVRMTLDLK